MYDNRNWLISIDEPNDERELPISAIDVNMVLKGMEEKGSYFNVVFIDCCRTFVGMSRSARNNTAGGLCAIAAPQGSLIAFACSPNRTASDGNGRNGVFTKHLLRHLPTRNKDIGRVLRAVGRGVEQETSCAQNPYCNSGLRVDEAFFCGFPICTPVCPITDQATPRLPASMALLQAKTKPDPAGPESISIADAISLWQDLIH